jgi:hypothetical protein
MSLPCYIGATLIGGAAVYLFMKWMTPEKKEEIHVSIPKAEQHKERIDPGLLEDFKNNSDRKFEMKVEINRCDKTSLLQFMKDNAIKERSTFDFGHEPITVCSEGAGKQYLKVLELDYVQWMGKILTFSIPENF